MATYTYQVQRSTDGSAWTDVSGASGSFDGISPFTHDISYLIQSGDVGDYLRCKVTDSFGNIKYSGLVGPAISATPPAPPPTTPGYRPFVSSSLFNTPIPSSAPIHPLSSHWISASNNWLLGGTANDAFKEWLGPRFRVLYLRGDTSGISTVPVYVNWSPITDKYGCSASPIANVPMPSDFAAILAGGSVDRDRPVAICDINTGDVWELYHLTPPGVASMSISCNTSRWNCIGYNHYVADNTKGTGYIELSGTVHNGFASESYCHIQAGAIVPEDLADLTNTDPIPHALAFIQSDNCNSNNNTDPSYPRHVSPARAGIGFNPTGAPYGARYQLDPSLDIDTWPSINAKSEPWRTALKKICKALQVYGMIMVDGSGSFGTGGFNACNPLAIANHTYNGQTNWEYPWITAGYGWSYANGLPYDLMSRFRVIKF